MTTREQRLADALNDLIDAVWVGNDEGLPQPVRDAVAKAEEVLHS